MTRLCLSITVAAPKMPNKYDLVLFSKPLKLSSVRNINKCLTCTRHLAGNGNRTDFNSQTLASDEHHDMFHPTGSHEVSTPNGYTCLSRNKHQMSSHGPPKIQLAAVR